MIVTTKDGRDVSGLFLRQMKGEITREEFMRLANITE